MQIKELCKKAHETAKKKGWWDGKKKSPLEIHALIHSEISEATEEVRNRKPYVYDHVDGLGNTVEGSEYIDTRHAKYNKKPEGEAIELVDAVIRIADWFEYNGWDMEKLLKLKMKYNDSRDYRHGGKKF